MSRMLGRAAFRALTLAMGLLCAGSVQAQSTSSVPMGSFGPGAASGTLANGVNWTVDKGAWHALQGYTILPNQGVQTWTFSPAVTLRFGIAGLNGTSECMSVPVGTVVESIHPNHTWNAANRTVCKLSGNQNDPVIQAATSVFVLDTPQTSLAVQAFFTAGYGRGVFFVEATTPTPQADLSITKTANPTSVVAGATVTYTLLVANGGPADAHGALVTDPGAPGLSCTSLGCSAANGAACPGSPTPAQLAAGLVIPALPANGSVTLTLACTLTGP